MCKKKNKKTLFSLYQLNKIRCAGPHQVPVNVKVYNLLLKLQVFVIEK